MCVATVVRLEDGVMQLFEGLVATDFDHAADFLVGELLADRPTHQVDRYDIQAHRSRRRGRCSAARLVGWTRRTLRLLASVPRRKLVIWDSDLDRPGLSRLAIDQPFLLQHLHHLIHRRRRDAHGRCDLGFGGRISVQIGVGVNERQITALSRGEVGHHSLSAVSVLYSIRIPHWLAIPQRWSIDIAMPATEPRGVPGTLWFDLISRGEELPNHNMKIRQLVARTLLDLRPVSG